MNKYTIISIFLTLIFLAYGVQVTFSSKAEIKKLEKEVKQLEAQNNNLVDKVNGLHQRKEDFDKLKENLLNENKLLEDDNSTAEEIDNYKAKILDLNKQLDSINKENKEESMVLLNMIEDEVKTFANKEGVKEDADKLLARVKEDKDSINNTNRLKDLVPYVNLKEKDENIDAIALLESKNNLFAYDSHKLYEINSKQVLEPKTINENDDIIKAVYLNDQDVFVFLNKTNGITEYENGDFNTPKTESGSWKTGVDISTYGKNIYILNPEENQIYKYSRSWGKYSNAYDYNSNANLKDAISLAIDSNLYVLKKGGEIIRIYQSKQADFKIENLGIDISNVNQIYTNTNSKKLYLLDSLNKQVIILNKNIDGSVASYEKQLIFEELDDIKNIYVNNNDSNLFLVTSSAIYRVDI